MIRQQYSTMGGQEGDKGYITTSEGEFKVDTTIKLKAAKLATLEL